MYEEESIFTELGITLLTNEELASMARRANRGKTKSNFLDLGYWVKDVFDIAWIGIAFTDEVHK